LEKEVVGNRGLVGWEQVVNTVVTCFKRDEKRRRAMKKRIFVMAFLVVGLLVFSAFTAEKVVKIGAFCPLTGPYVDIGTQIANGIELAVGLQNEAGGIEIGGEKYQVKIVWGDTESKVEVGLSVIDKLITIDKIDVAVGFLHSHIFMPAMEKFQAYHVPVVNASAAATSIFQGIAEGKLDYVFQMSPTSPDLVISLAEAVYNVVRPSKVAFFDANTDYGRDEKRVLTEWFSENAPEVDVVSNEFFEFEATGFLPELAKIKASGAEVILGQVYGAPASTFLEQWYELQVPALIADMGGATSSQTYIDEHKEMIEGAIVNNRWWPGPYTPISAGRVARYEQEYGVSPTTFAVQGHDATLIAMMAIDRADSLDKRDIRAELEGGSFTTIWGEKVFTPLREGHRCPITAAIVQVQNGKKVPIWPLDIATEGQWMPVPPWPWEK